MPDMTPTPHAAAVAPRTGKILFLKEEKIYSVNRQKLRWKVRI